MAKLLAVSLICTLCIVFAEGAAAAPICPAGVSSDKLEPLPSSLVEKAKTLFGLSMPDDLVQRTTLMRCADGTVMMCNLGANLPCGKANTSQTSAGATAWCHDNPNANVVPAFAVGHDTIYLWHCDNGIAKPGKQIEAVDKRGFVARYWKKAE